MNNKKSEPQDMAASSRNRTVSECSYNSDDISGFTGKRQRTTSQTFMVASGLTAASPPKFVSLEEIMQAANGMKDMNLVHQIVVDDNFRLEKAEPEPNTVQRVIKDTMTKAFWDVLKEQLAEDPPNYNQAMKLLEEIKHNLFDLLLPQHTKIKQQISEVLDIDLIRQQAEKGILDFNYYAQYVISIMAKMCAQVRDEKINELKQTTDVIEVYKGILETLELMQLDMANFTLQIIRPDIIKNSVELEREKFASYLAIQPDGLQHTRKWLLNHTALNEPVPTNVEYEKFIRSCTKKVFTRACIDLIDWDRTQPYPETFILDEERLYDLQVRTFRLITAATILLVTLSNAGPDLQTIGTFKQSLKDHIMILIQNIKNNEDLDDVLPNIAEQVVNDVKEAQAKYDLQGLVPSNETSFKDIVIDSGKDDHKVRTIVKQRIKDFFLDIIESATAAPQKVPSGLTAFQRELTEIAGQFLRIVSHNSTVFSIYYSDIIAAALPKP
ncbi:T-complex protein 11-like protein 1 [Sitophilus oryzae]|uniref:T-complex protein 11-like protein 1 n=1 Tax=Sitophilus oryzae TaxID=7048 RepID=A0A6J2YCK7_SITOR|nr:T-complex protein 11-like protein 1 [Sitophilus oryzae]XP_030761055.1 T-complex protein 11-like protein 1 [Sitophilus oryzae]XP_030761056.1 T-complex protein 11-like protein 1 [Sitophilus oryzae]